jgi:hypothetical protein
MIPESFVKGYFRKRKMMEYVVLHVLTDVLFMRTKWGFVEQESISTAQ